MIDSYSFGNIIIDQTTYNSDIIIYPDGRVKGDWWRASGHRLTKTDIQELIDSRPELIIVGTGASGMMKPDPQLGAILAESKIAFEAMPTKQASERYNSICGEKRVGACFHLTC